MKFAASKPQPTMTIKENWLTRKPNPDAFNITFFAAFFLFAISTIFFNNYFNAQTWLSASGEQVFNHHQYWRAWTALLVHGDWGHLLSNALLFLPLTFLFTSFYGYLFFPLAGLFIGGLVNLAVLKTMDPQTSLLGISGVVYWMGAAWLTLYFLVDRRESRKRRLARAVLLTVLLFAPEAYKPQISYMSHFFGFIAGIVSAIGYYYLNRRQFLAAEVKDYVYEPDEVYNETEDNPLQNDGQTTPCNCA